MTTTIPSRRLEVPITKPNHGDRAAALSRDANRASAVGIARGAPLPPPVTILLVDDHALVRAAYRALLERTPRFLVVGDAADAASGIRMAGALAPDVVLLDIQMPGMSGLDAVRPIKDLSCRSRVLMASLHEAHRFVLEAMRAGADGYLSKNSDPVELPLAVDCIARGNAYISPRVSSGLMVSMLRGDPIPELDRSRLSALTDRERVVFQMLAVGKANKEVAAHLGIALGTVKKHRENLQRKLECRSPACMARLAIQEGLLEA